MSADLGTVLIVLALALGWYGHQARGAWSGHADARSALNEAKDGMRAARWNRLRQAVFALFLAVLFGALIMRTGRS